MEPVDAATLLLRVGAGAMIAMHGWAHIVKKGTLAIKGTAGWFGSMGMRWPVAQAWLASVTELGAGALLTLGLLTPVSAAGLFAVMIVAFVIAHRKNGFFIYNPGQGWEYVAVIAVMAVAIGTLGGGQVSLDDAFGIDVFRGWRGLWTVLVAGGGGAALLLATCWRPPRPSAS
jgi:putative oxidoreductase